MKQKDIALIILIAGVAAAMSYAVAGMVFKADKVYNLKAPKVEVITDKFDVPEENSKYFNKNSIDPTVDIKIGKDDNNSKPF